MTANRPTIARLKAEMELIRALRYPSASELARRLEISSKTVYRDIDLLRDQLSVPLEFSVANRGWFVRGGRVAIWL